MCSFKRLSKCLYARLYDTHSSQRDKTNPFPCVAVSSINVAAALASSPSIKAESSQRRVVNARVKKKYELFQVSFICSFKRRKEIGRKEGGRVRELLLYISCSETYTLYSPLKS